LSIFPQISIPTNTLIQSTQQTTTLPLYKEYAWDFTKNDFLLKDGKFQIVTGLEALKVWINKALLTARYRYLAYSWNYGNELDNLVGQGLSSNATQSEAQRYVEECLSVNPYIQGITSFSITLDGSKISMGLTVLTVYGEVDISV
jgi:hypothetical protein